MQTKATPPIDLLDGKSTHQVVRAYLELNQLKQLYRQGWLRVGIPRERCESVAEHSFGVAFLTLLLAENFVPGVDATRAVRMALVHDLGEARVGDITPHDPVAQGDKHAREREAVRTILEGLSRADEYLALWEEYEAGTSPEARLVRQVDRLEMGLQACVYEHHTGKDLSEFFASMHKVLEEEHVREVARAAEAIRPARAG